MSRLTNSERPPPGAKGLSEVGTWVLVNKMLSYRRETALMGALVLAKSGGLELGDNILWTSQVYLQPL